MTKPAAKHRWTKWALIASLAVNALVVFAVVGAVVTGGPDRRGPDRRGGGGPPEIAALARGLDDEARRALFRGLRENGRLSGARERLAAGRAEIAAALRSDPFDPAALQTALEMQRSVQAEMADRGVEVLSEVVAGLTPAERAALADRLEQWRGFRGDRR